MQWEDLPDQLPEHLKFEPCAQGSIKKFFTITPVWSGPEDPSRAKAGANIIRLAACCVGHAMLFGWREAEEINSMQVKVHKPGRITGVIAKLIEGEEAEELRAMIEKAKEKDQL